MQNFARELQCHAIMKKIPFVILIVLILIFITINNNYGDCRPQSGLPSQPQSGVPSQPQSGLPSQLQAGSSSLDSNSFNNNNNLSNNMSGVPRRGWRGEWRRTDPGTVYSYIWKSSDQPLGKAELYIILALLIGMATVIVGCWLSDNCWSPEPEQHYTIAWHDRHRWI